ncbi:MAG: acetyl-CoA carboxylase biotin carboxyl carrier protein [Planctomycetota bacterium]|jgi:acetyl-CoA carboxylase biotin carboxyl carrier protein|nr:acetyl-CoA carboxylase biotin carboxyl carrier protein [Planctomycetota bacterium]OUW02122.1 MAG: acetyl-CoA carboxylase, biotin carboxyl carrier protein [Phycisphaera sp. TMED151]RZO51739.1 MAG: acetyl-CoA carboxylase biotin carboxyl carrier protein [Phycisphaeraceae bacterium]MEC8092837.1 acetyl-CoA carboxylase biotin carboxyl carrier protein [Planctomycetota bacterium]MEC8770868.1 acetyl-CoA carboxylase biotin carboxyl carrier protein [Planctomycetota bacterium]
MLDIRKLKELIRLMVENELTEIDLKDEKETVSLRREGSQAPVVQVSPTPSAPPAAPAPAMASAPAPAPTAPAAAPASEPSPADTSNLEQITSPMVGTFYSAAKPESPAFAKVGDTVTADTTVCIVEAMKIFNEIKAEQSGVIEKVLVSNGDSVEFGQALFLVRPA